METKTLKTITIILGVVLAIVAVQDISMVNELTKDKKDLTVRIQDLQAEYNNLSSDYDEINAQLDSSREVVAQLVEQIKQTEATNRAKMRKYEKELGTLRNLMRGYVAQIDSLNNQNKRLAAELSSSRDQLAKSTQANEVLTAKVEDLSAKVSVGSIVRARDIDAVALNASGRETDRSSRTTQIAVNLSLVENALAAKGWMKVYAVVTDPDGKVISDGSDVTFKKDGKATSASAAREVDYQGSEVDLTVYVANVEAFVKGVYTVEVFTDKAQLGSVEVSLR